MSNRAVVRLLARRPRIGHADAPAEGHADRIAERVVRGDPPAARSRHPGAALAPGLGGGRGLGLDLRRRLAPHFGVDLARVRLHADRSADAASRALGAQGFSIGRDVFLRSDRADPRTRGGLGVLAHELAHVDAGRGGPPTLRCKGGLPTGENAEVAGGGSGLWGMGKGAWGDYQTTLDAYRKCPEEETEEQITLLETLETISRSIMTNERWKKEKKAFVAKTLPAIKLAYYELTTRREVVDPIRREAAAVEDVKLRAIDASIRPLMNKWRTVRQKAEKTRLEAAGTLGGRRAHQLDVEMPEAPSGRDLLDHVRDTKVTVNFAPGTLSYWLDDPTMKQFWELGRDALPEGTRQGAVYARQREDAERWMGYRPMIGTDGEIDEGRRGARPISAALNITGDPRGAAPQYGEWHFELRDAIKARCTVSSHDSIDGLQSQWSGGAHRFNYYGTLDHAAPLLLQNQTFFKSAFLGATGAEGLDNGMQAPVTLESLGRSMRTFDTYVEAQVHGGISMSDVDTLVVPTSTLDGARKATIAQWKLNHRSKGVKVRYV